MNMFSFQFKRSLYSPIDLYNLGARLNNAAGDAVKKVPNGEVVANALTGALGNLVAATEREKANPYTVLIRDKDLVRDNDLLSIRDAIRSNTHKVKNSEVLNAAADLNKVFDLHIGNVSKLGIGEENKAVSYLIESLMGGENRAKCEKIGIVPLIESLSQTQKELDALYVERARLSSEPGRETVKNAMNETANAVRQFLGFVDVMVSARGEGAEELASEVRSILADVEAIARSRKTRLQNRDEAEPQEPASKAA
jgi:hypothetical protein